MNYEFVGSKRKEKIEDEKEILPLQVRIIAIFSYFHAILVLIVYPVFFPSLSQLLPEQLLFWCATLMTIFSIFVTAFMKDIGEKGRCKNVSYWMAENFAVHVGVHFIVFVSLMFITLFSSMAIVDNNFNETHFSFSFALFIIALFPALLSIKYLSIYKGKNIFNMS